VSELSENTVSRPGAPTEASSAAEGTGRDVVGGGPLRWAARLEAALLRLATLVVAALGLSAAGLLFVVLLPICGVATIAEAIARRCLEELRGGLPQNGCDKVPQV
jgi:hypothetical protein